MLASNHIPTSQWPGAILGQVGSSALAADEMLAIMHDDDNCGLAPEDMVELMIQKMTEMYDDVSPDQLIERLFKAATE